MDYLKSDTCFSGLDSNSYSVLLTERTKMKTATLFLLLVTTTCLLLASKGTTAFEYAAEFTILLDNDNARERWEDVVIAYQQQIRDIIPVIRNNINNNDLRNTLLNINENNIGEYVGNPYKDEIIGIAERLNGVTVGDIVMINVYYEIAVYGNLFSKNTSIACTGIVASDDDSVLHGRNLDYDMYQLLKNMVVTVKFMKDGQLSYVGTTFAGYIGLLTGLKPKRYTISLNERREHLNGHDNAWIGNLDTSVAFAIRTMLSEDDLYYEHAKGLMEDAELSSPCYIIMGGVKKGEGAVITKSMNVDSTVIDLSTENEWFVVQTNFDQGHLNDNRIDAVNSLRDKCDGKATYHCLRRVMTTHPVKNVRTIYTVIMTATTPFTYQSIIYN